MERIKIGRNDKCWCGSGIKYKKCHFERELQEPISSWDASGYFRKAFLNGVCSAPESYKSKCSSKIIRAHTVPKSSSLKSIARNGHVYGLNCSLENIQKNKGKIEPELIGVNKASTFSGFCGYHDGLLFQPIEQYRFSNTPEQCFLLAYRAFSREFYTKKAMADVQANLMRKLDKGKGEFFQIDLQEKNFLMSIGIQLALRDNEYHKAHLDKCLESDNYEKIRAISFKLNAPPPVMVSGATNPTHDFLGGCVQDLMDDEKAPDCWSATSFYDGESGWIVFSWLENSEPSCKAVVETLLAKPKGDWAAYLLQYLFSNFENFFISPEWWEATDSLTKKQIMNLLLESADPMEAINGDGIKSPILNINFPEICDVTTVGW
jgi:hypothetical protein